MVIAAERDDAGRDDPLLAVGVGDEALERAHALGQAGGERRPLGGADHAGHGVDAKLVVALARAEGHAAAAEVAGDVVDETGQV